MKPLRKYQSNIDPDSFHKKIKAYSSLAGTFIALVPAANAGIIYTDIDPDTTLNSNGETYALDLNNDATPDFLFSFSSGAYTSSGVPTVFRYASVNGNSNSVAASLFSSSSVTFNTPYRLNSGENIDSNLRWGYGRNFLGTFLGIGSNAYNFGNWPGQSDKYLGLRFQINGQTHYGWARIDVGNETAFMTIKDYAYEDTPNTPIVAGDKGLPVRVPVIAELNDNINVYSFGKTVRVNIPEIEKKDKGEMYIYNTLGQVIHKEKVTKPSFSIELQNVSPDIYIVEIRLESGMFRKQLFLN